MAEFKNLTYNNSKNMLNLILFGAPGAGKGTQAKKISEKFHLLHLSTGDILRKAVANKTELGIIAKEYLDRGNLLPDDIMIKMVENTIKKNTDVQGFIFDGFPRTIAQAEAFDKMLVTLNMAINCVIHLRVEKDILVDRLLKRAEIEGRSDDADKSIIENRITLYKQKTKPVKEYYSKLEKLTVIDGLGEIDDIFEQVDAVLSEKL